MKPPVTVAVPAPNGRVTTMSESPLPAGVTKVSCVSLLLTTEVAFAPPTVTVGVPLTPKPSPTRVTGVPPTLGPDSGKTVETVAALALGMATVNVEMIARTSMSPKWRVRSKTRAIVVSPRGVGAKFIDIVSLSKDNLSI